MQYVLPFLVAMVIAMALLPLLSRWAGPLKIVDPPGARKVHQRTMPRIGGLAMAIGAAIALVTVPELNAQAWAFVAGAAVLLAFGLLDDRLDLDYRLKLLGQLLAIGIVVFGGGIAIHWITLDERLELPAIIAVPLTVLFLVGITNAINLADGLDGLAGGTSFLCFCALGLLANLGGQTQATLLASIFAGATLGFLRFNTYPATVFMGDAGSQLLGFVAGVLSILATQADSTAVSTALPLLLLGVPILDTLWVMVQRLSERRSPFSPDKNHIHHKLLALGFDHHEAVMVIYVIQALLFIGAYLLRFTSDGVIVAAFAGFAVVSIALLQLAGASGWRFRSRPASSTALMARIVSAARRADGLPRLALGLVMASLVVYAACVIVASAQLATDLRVLLLPLTGAAFLTLAILRGRPLLLFDKAILYVVAAVIVYLDVTVPTGPLTAPLRGWLLPLLIAGGTATYLRLAPDRRFALTPLDLIVVFVVLIVPNLPGILVLPAGAPMGIAKLLVVFYALEMVSADTRIRSWPVRLGAVLAVGGLLSQTLLAIR